MTVTPDTNGLITAAQMLGVSLSVPDQWLATLQRHLREEGMCQREFSDRNAEVLNAMASPQSSLHEGEELLVIFAPLFKRSVHVQNPNGSVKTYGDASCPSIHLRLSGVEPHAHYCYLRVRPRANAGAAEAKNQVSEVPVHGDGRCLLRCLRMAIFGAAGHQVEDAKDQETLESLHLLKCCLLHAAGSGGPAQECPRCILQWVNNARLFMDEVAEANRIAEEPSLALIKQLIESENGRAEFCMVIYNA